MSDVKNKSIIINVKDLSFKSDQLVIDLIRFLSEALPQITLNRQGKKIEVEMPIKLSKRALRLRIKKFLYKKGLHEDFRPISYKSSDIEGYTIKEKKVIQLSYY
uniref:Putative ribosomal protein L22e-like protein n=3 Tax=unclassified sequences TaxID=12908 RepID=A0A0F6PY97_9ZZZZ|nr:putative ribosomal protein L22e-like protein [uncultured organism]